MDKLGQIEIRITGYRGNLELHPDNYDIREVIAILNNVENLLYPSEKKERPIISYKLEEGSVKHIFKTSLQYIIGFNAIIGQINQVHNIDFLDISTATAIENIQNISIKQNYAFSLKTSLEQTNEFYIDKTTKYFRTAALWVDADLYFYGKITNAGGKDKANIHLFIEELGTVRIQTPISFLEQYDENLLYKTFGIHAIGKQHSETGEIDTSSLKFIELIDYRPKYDENYLSGLRMKAKKNWLGMINTENWLSEVRGGYD
ncbi:MAG: hypothetical protein WC313_05295 [Candidatus Kapaibacterium sp.]